MAKVIATDGSEVLSGTAAADNIEARLGGDTINAGDGDDVILDVGGIANIINAGAGDDRINFLDSGNATVVANFVTSTLIDAGDGADIVLFESAAKGSASINLGAGDDVLLISQGDETGYGLDNLIITLGSGSDRVDLGFGLGNFLRGAIAFKPIVIADLSGGAGGDVLNIADLLRGFYASPTPLTVFPAENPFASGHMLLIQDGADTLVRLDYDGNGPGEGETYWRDIVRLTNINASQLTAANFGGWSPDGADSASQTSTGTSQADRLYAGATDSTLSGLGGNDILSGGAGDDALSGGDGADELSGGAGEDTLAGDAGSDRLDGGDGDDLLRGGLGDDTITDTGGNDIIEGGGGDDEILLIRAVQPAYGTLRSDTVSIDAGDGNDRVIYTTADFFGPGWRLVDVNLTVVLGAGDDTFFIDNARATTTLTLGAGQDRVELGTLSASPNGGLIPLVITDFVAGNSGDILDVGLLLALGPSWSQQSNPFAGGFLRLEQSGANVRVLWDADGTAPLIDVMEIALLKGVQADSLTAANFNGYAPDRGALAGGTIIGTAEGDRRNGTGANDSLNGLGGDDYLDGGFGNDLLDGGAGNDALEGGYGDDTLIGGIGDDVLSDTAEGSDSLSGGDGDDRIEVRHTVFRAETVTVAGGAGDDTLEFEVAEMAGQAVTATADMGSGNDRVTLLGFASGGITLTLGAGVDTLTLDASLASQARGAITVTDFQTGASGDVLDWIGYMQLFGRTDSFVTVYPDDGTDPYNPFLTGQARLFQAGADTLLQMGRDVNGRFTEYEALVVFKSTLASSFTVHNLGIDFALDTVPSTSGADIFAGTAARDVVRGGDGADQLTGLGGSDLLAGGAGNDSLNGGADDDTLYGGVGKDAILGGDGGDVIDGGAGADTIGGGGGDDRLTIDGTDIVDAGSGNDRVYLRFGWYQDADSLPLSSLDAGVGDDFIIVRDAANGDEAGGYSIELGAGNDRIITDGSFGTLSLGGGSDRIETVAGVNGSPLVITDFQPGSGGDVFVLSSLYPQFDLFAVGAVNLVQDGGDVVLALNASSRDLGVVQIPVRFLGTTVSQFTAFNFAGQNPAATPATATTVIDGSSVVIAAGTTRTIANPAPFAGASAFLYASHSGTDAFINHGTVNITADSTPLGGALTGFRTELNPVFPISGAARFLNAADGRFVVSTAQSSAVGFQGTGLPFRNEGYFEVTATGAPDLFSEVVGADVFSDPLATGNTAFNSGTMLVQGGLDTYGVKLRYKATLDNRGTIEVHGPDFAVGVRIFEAYGEQFNNSGTITAIADPGATYLSVGLLLESRLPNDASHPTILRNSGTIDAEIAVQALDVSTTGFSEHLINSGDIHGAVLLADGNDLVVNSGTMDSRTLLGSGNDRYDGAAGEHFGSVEGGDGDDTLIGGAHADFLYGDAQDDVLSGGSGDDYLEGGQGNDRLDGGSGFDVVSYLGSPLSIIADLDAGTVDTVLDSDEIGNFEEIIGSRGDDVITGSARAEVFAGFRGSDRIDGRGGDDTLVGGAGDDVLTGGSGNDRFIYDAGDSRDEITDFAAGDTIEVYGYSQYQSLQQVGADLRIVFSANDSVLLRGATAAKLNAQNLLFDAGSSGIFLPDIADETLFPRENLIIGASAVFDLTDTQPLRVRYVPIESTAIALNAPVGVEGLGVWNAGTVRFTTSDAVPVSAVIATSIANPYGGRNHWFVNQESGTIEVIAAHSKAVGSQGVGAVWNFGTISATSLSGDASGVLGLHPNTYGPVKGTFVNAGTITVDAAAVGRGVDQTGNTGSATQLVNSGEITVVGGVESRGIEFYMSAHPLAEQPQLVNSGVITVADDTAAIDSAGLYLDVASRGTIWNSGTITADYAIKVIEFTSYLPGGDYSLTVFNTGELRGQVLLSAYDDLLVNADTIEGDVHLGRGDDVYDGRLGRLSGVLDGYDGDDTLLAGAGSQTILGGFGADVLSGGAGADTLTGGAGVDSFRFGTGFGTDTITDFETGAHHDFIDVSGYSTYQSIVQQGSDVRIAFSASDVLVVRNAAVADLTGSIRFGVAAPPGQTIPDAPQALPAPPVPDGSFSPAGFFALLAAEGFRGEIGGSGSIFGTIGFEEVTILDLPGTIDFDPSSNRGGDVIHLVGNAGDWQIQRSGSSAMLSDGDTVVTIPVGTASIAVAFDDGARSLRYDIAAANLKIGSQNVDANYAAIAAPADIADLPDGPGGNGESRLILSEGAAVMVGGDLSIFGTEASEHVFLTKGLVELDPSFNRGGDILTLDAFASQFAAARSGSNATLTAPDYRVDIPVGTAGMILHFADGDRELLYDTQLASIMIGAQQIGTTPVMLSEFG